MAKVPETSWSLQSESGATRTSFIHPSALVLQVPERPGVWVLSGYETNTEGFHTKRLVECGETEIGVVGPSAQTGAGMGSGSV